MLNMSPLFPICIYCNKSSPLFLTCVWRKSVSEPGNSISIRSASKFEFSITNLKSTLVLLNCKFLLHELLKHLGHVEQYQYHLCAHLTNTNTTLCVRLRKSTLISPTISTKLYIYPFYTRMLGQSQNQFLTMC